MIRLSHHWALALLIVGAACSSPATESSAPPPSPPVFTIAPHDIWAGSTVTIASSAFHGAVDTTGVAQFNGQSLVLHRLDDTTLSVDLPSTTMAGSYPLSIQFAAVVKALDPFTVYGYADSTSYPIQNDWDTYAWPRGTGHAMVMGTDDSNTIHLIDLDTHAVSSIRNLGGHGPAGLGYGLQGPGFTYADDSALIVEAHDTAFATPQHFFQVQLNSPGALAAQPSPYAFLDGPAQHIMRLGPTTWFISGKGGSYVVTDVDSASTSFSGSPTQLLTGGNAVGVFMSPQHNRATYAPDNLPGPLPVFTVPSGAVAFTVPMNGGTSSVDFSADGALLAVTGGTGSRLGHFGRIIMVNASDGSIQHDTTIATSAYLVSFDPLRPIVYITTFVSQPGNAAQYPEVIVLDRATFRVVGRLDAPLSWSATCDINFSGTLATSLAGALYLFRGCYTHPSSVALRFTLPQDDGLH